MDEQTLLLKMKDALTYADKTHKQDVIEMQQQKDKIEDLKHHLLESNRKIAELESTNRKLSDKIQNLEEHPLRFKLDYDSFVSTYLINEYTKETMPKSGGIYAYLNPTKQLLYVGQSVDMYNRLKQHFRNGKLKISGHDASFKDEDAWHFFVLEFISREQKKKLDNREAYWIALARVAVSNRRVYDTSKMKDFEKDLQQGHINVKTNFAEDVKTKGRALNVTRGNHVGM